ncbi:MAG TPA: maltose alpha-D-glucosyltransferase [Vicinamibacterales bacterium]|nr:maltose alpha-D-glucosyltransferase [Vicinamibacterales bacterium]
MNDPLWYKDAVIYEAHVKSFFDSNNDGIGDFNGLTQKLDYLQGLGVTCVWLLPFFPSPLKDDGYDVADYRNVHPSYGTLDDFTAFVQAAHARGLKILIELVVNHTSDQHPWFQRARQAPAGSPERDFYVWSDSDKKFPETRIIFSDTEKSNWAWDPVAGQYYWHRFFSHQPDLNHNNPAVVEAVIDVLRFWLDRGVDALRLDAVAYLCVREGTSNENLPETHEVLKRMRRELDASYPNRMLLAEANQWPSDVRPYFGDGDECHMAFHFPLMPRMFMALRQEDRHAITEILNQTPELPPSAQWALFLRNHDELTVEMITDEERDYMYSVYANDPQMRINGGIRRRLAPLVENSRRRVELLTVLLFSLPGTPVIYYGDEIGMGDNIYLGDRNGVRTPMQWSSDRNAGFSRADPARLFAPTIQDPVYGYQAINVEAQERAPFSLLNWTKRMVALRRQHPVFGRGSLEFIGCPNRKILAYLRRDDRETILVVVNLSRDVQPAALDLAGFAGLMPVEMKGLAEFPRIGDQPYFLTLSPYGSYWFTLQQGAMPVTQRATVPADADTAIRDALPALLMGVDWNNLLDAGTRAVLEQQALLPFLRRQRWMAPGREIRRARFADWAPLRSGQHPSFLAVVTVDYVDGDSESCVLALALIDRDAAEAALQQAPGGALARITGARKGAVVDGLNDRETRERLIALVETTGTVSTRHGSVRGMQTNALPPGGERYLKLFRRIEPTPSPELDIGRFLTGRGFTRTPALAGAIEYLRPGLEPGTLAVVQLLVKHQGTAWDFAIDELRRYYERATARVKRTDAREGLEERERHEGQDDAEGPPPFFVALEQWYLTSATTLGRRTAELHAALTGEPPSAFAPEPLDRDAIGVIANQMRAHGDAALDLLAQRLTSLDEVSRREAEAILAGREALLARFDTIRLLDDAGRRIRVHGDYHLGQVLRTEEDFVILDFAGDPAQSIAERRTKQSPLKDVAGMIRSYGYAAYAALFAFGVHAPDDYAALEPWAGTWEHWVTGAFVKGYLAGAGESPLLPRDQEGVTALLSAFVLDKALRELAYELHGRPDWVRVPLAGVYKLIRSVW